MVGVDRLWTVVSRGRLESSSNRDLKPHEDHTRPPKEGNTDQDEVVRRSDASEGNMAVPCRGWKGWDVQSRRRTRVVVAQAKDMKLCKDMVVVPQGNKGDPNVKYQVTFLGAKGQQTTIEVPSDTYLLDAGNEAGLELPFTCRGGICGTCSGRIVEGTVDQSDVSDLEFVLEPEQIEQGVALLCMARPLSDCVVETQCDWGYSLVTGEGWRGATGQKGKPNPIMGKKWDEFEKSEEQS